MDYSIIIYSVAKGTPEKWDQGECLYIIRIINNNKYVTFALPMLHFLVGDSSDSRSKCWIILLK